MENLLYFLLVIAVFGGLFASLYFIPKWLGAADRRAERRNAARLAAEMQKTAAGVQGDEERALLKKCTNCNIFCLTLPFRDSLGRTYCSAVCMKWLAEGPRQFCKRCTLQTTAESCGDLVQEGGTGRTFLGSSQLCGECGSFVRRVWFTVLYVPVLPLRQYRVQQVSPRQFISRRCRK